MLISLSNVSNVFQNGHCRIFSLFRRLFRYHSNGIPVFDTWSMVTCIINQSKEIGETKAFNFWLQNTQVFTEYSNCVEKNEKFAVQ